MITRITGISNEMVANAPRFCEVARKIVEMTEGATFVGHNAAFDYNFIRHEFKRLGYNYRKPTICTVKMSRKLLPGKQSYSLGKLCQELGIIVENRHRAAGDALATTRLLELLLQADRPAIEKQSGFSVPDMIKEVPEEAGVYYLHDEKGKVIYIGKSKNMFGRLLQHFRNNDTVKAVEMRSRVASVSYESTGSELIALLLESSEIKKHKPLYNRTQRRSIFSSGLFEYFDEHGYHCLSIGRNLNGHQPVTSFTTLEHARNYLYGLVEKFELCQKLSGLYDTDGACFQYGIKQCRGACIGKESPEQYNRRVEAAIRLSGFSYNDFLIIDRGRHNDEAAVVKIAGGRYIGFGFTGMNDSGTENLHNCIKQFDDNRDTRQIIRNYLKKNPRTRILKINNNEFS
jgi:DNA polymerase-3 subunit epsilon